jgi:hypothetical protein
MNRFACRPFLREALAASGPLAPSVQAHVDGCAFCTHRLQASSRLVFHLRQRPQLSPAAAAQLVDGVWERIVEQAESTPFAATLANEVPKPSPGHEGWPEALLESSLARRALATPCTVAPASWERVKTSILDQVAGARVRRVHRHWWLGLLGAAVAAGIVLVVVHGGGQEPPRITFRDLASLPGADSGGASLPGGMPVIDFAVIRHGAPR